MNTAAFLTAIWPLTGHYCLVLPKKGAMEHVWFESIDNAAAFVGRMNEAGRSVFHACAAFKEPGTQWAGRSGPNTRAMRAFWLDLDVGAGEAKFPDIPTAAKSLKAFVDAVALPPPMIVSSGAGLHVYWPLHEEIDNETWWAQAKSLKAITAHHGFKADPTRTADRASILRPVGSINTKYDPPREVKVVRVGEPSHFADIAQALQVAVATIPQDRPTRVRKDSINAEFMPSTDFPPSDANKVANQCAQLRGFRDKQGDIPEPQWYSGIQVLYHCTDGERIIHEWSSGHKEYSAKQTDAKIIQIKDLGPTTCATFESRNPVGCVGCPHRGKVTSPIQLGTSYEAAPNPVVPTQLVAAGGDDEPALSTFVEPPRGYRRTSSGIVYVNPDAIEILIYPYDMFVTEILKDDTHGYEVCVVRHCLPKDGWQEFSFRSSAVASDKDFEQAMRDNHIKPLSAKLLRGYISGYMAEVQKAKPMRPLYHSMGWKDDMNSFVLGNRRYHANGAVELCSMGKPIKPLADAMEPKGDIDKWIEAASVLDGPGMQAHALMFGAAPGAPLMKFTGFEAALFNGVGDTNSGKTSMGRLLMSMYGDFDALKLRQQDTHNARIKRISALGSLPSYIDEVTNIDPKDLSDFVYEITQGRSKLGLKQDGSERTTYEWNTIVVSSANTPLTGKLGAAKANPEAERMRLFEFRVGRQNHFDSRAGTRLFDQLVGNRGHAGHEYIQYLVTHREEVRVRLTAFTEKFRDYCKAKPEERMWMASLSCALFGLKLMTELGLLKLNVDKVVQWAAAQVRVNREAIATSKSTSLDLLGLYFNQFADTRLSLHPTSVSANPDYHVDRYPHREMRMRFDSALGRMWIDARHIERWLSQEGEDWAVFLTALKEERVLLGRARMTLGKGTPMASGQVACLEIDMRAPALGNNVLQLVATDVAAEARRATEGRSTI